MSRLKTAAVGGIPEQEVAIKEMNSWFLKITDYADDMLEYCEKLPGWPDRVMSMQKELDRKKPWRSH